MWADLSRASELAEALAGDRARALELGTRALALRNVAARRNAVRVLRAAGEAHAPLQAEDRLVQALWPAAQEGTPNVMHEALQAIRVLQGLPAVDFDAPYPGVPPVGQPQASGWERESPLGILWRCAVDEIPWDERKEDPRVRSSFGRIYKTRMDRGMNGIVLSDASILRGTRREVLERIQSGLESGIKKRRREALQALWVLQDPMALGAAEQCLEAEDNAVRRDALVTVGFIGGWATFDKLAEVSRTRTPDAQAASAGLAVLADARLFGLLWQEVADGTPRSAVFKSMPFLDEAGYPQIPAALAADPSIFGRDQHVLQLLSDQKRPAAFDAVLDTAALLGTEEELRVLLRRLTLGKDEIERNRAYRDAFENGQIPVKQTGHGMPGGPMTSITMPPGMDMAFFQAATQWYTMQRRASEGKEPHLWPDWVAWGDPFRKYLTEVMVREDVPRPRRELAARCLAVTGTPSSVPVRPGAAPPAPASPAPPPAHSAPPPPPPPPRRGLRGLFGKREE